MTEIQGTKTDRPADDNVSDIRILVLWIYFGFAASRFEFALGSGYDIGVHCTPCI